jgi:hypothetical protein
VTIQDLGSIGEFIAAIATIATLIYLARQLRANTRAVEADARRAHIHSASGANLAIAQNGELANIVVAGLVDFSSLPPADRMRFSFFLGEVCSGSTSVFDEVEAGNVPSSRLENQIEILRQFLRTPGGRQWWSTFKPTFPPTYAAFIDARILAPEAGE